MSRIKITAPGVYITRAGFRVNVVSPILKSHGKPDRIWGEIIYPPTDKEAAMHIKSVRKDFLWFGDGSAFPLHNSGLDIVGVWPYGKHCDLAMDRMPRAEVSNER